MSVLKIKLSLEHSKGSKIATFPQSARCTVVKQPDLAAIPPKSGRFVKDKEMY